MSPYEKRQAADLVSRLESALKWATRLRDDAEMTEAECRLIVGTLNTLTMWAAQTADVLHTRMADGLFLTY